ncbi:unnamed protein product [Owenia fusiformis]|uniref:Uncharacterized protein n=1 Tax=Owenia fusiformis TaxID=6347 RepID=A0A8J1XSW9_OWEFU|nr:unnamed protein product [Owenia fusiformis]
MLEIIVPVAKQVHYAFINYDKYRKIVRIRRTDAVDAQGNPEVSHSVYDFKNKVVYRIYLGESELDCLPDTFTPNGMEIPIIEGLTLDLEKLVVIDSSFTHMGQETIRDGLVTVDKLVKPGPSNDPLTFGKTWYIASRNWTVRKTHYEGTPYQEPMKLSLSLQNSAIADVNAFDFDSNRPHLRNFDVSDCYKESVSQFVNFVMSFKRDALIVRVADPFVFEWIEVSLFQKDYFTFEVKAWLEVRLLLSEIYGRSDNKVYEIGLGVRGNQASSISTIALGSKGVEVPTQSILNGNEYRQFWISWANGNVQVGRGSVRGQNTFMSYQVTQPIRPMALALFSVNGNQIPGLFKLGLPGALVVDTPPNFKYQFVGVDISWETGFVFQLVAKMDAHILLTSKMNTYTGKVYELILGGNENNDCMIKDQFAAEQSVARVPCPGVLNENERRTFWVSWKNGKIEFGRSNIIGFDPLVAYQDAAPLRVRHLALATETGISGHWVFYTLSPDISKFIMDEDQVDVAVETLTNMTSTSIVRYSNSKIDFDDDNVHLTSSLLPIPFPPDLAAKDPTVFNTADDDFGRLQNLVYSGLINIKFKYGLRLSAFEVRKGILTDPNNYQDTYVKRFSKDASRVMYIDKLKVSYGITIQKCALMCLSQDVPRCESFDYCPNMGECQISEKHVADGAEEGSFRNHSFCDHYSRSYITDKFEVVPGQVMSGNYDDIQNDVSAEVCAKKCIDTTTFICESFDYCTSTKTCLLSKDHKDSSGVTMVNRTDCSHYTKASVGQFKTYTGMVMTDYEQSIMVNISREACTTMCIEESGFPCKSFNYCPTSRGQGYPTCSLNNKLRSEVPGSSFQPDADCNYYERTDTSSLPPQRNKYSSGQMAGLGIGLLALGLAVGCGLIVLLTVFLKQRVA